MNLSKFLVLGSLEAIKEGSGYDIKTYLEQKQVDKWTDIKKGSLYFAIKQLENDGLVEVIRKVKDGAFPTKSIYGITEPGHNYFDQMQDEAFLGLYPYFYGFKLALKFNSRRSNEEICDYAYKAISRLDDMIKLMTHYSQKQEIDDEIEFFMKHDYYIIEAEKKWIMQVVERYS